MSPNDQRMTGEDPEYWQKAVNLPSFRELIAAKKKLLMPMVLMYFSLFMGMTLLAGYGKEFMTQKVVGSFNMAYLLVLGCYIMCWVMGVIYVRVANRDFDALATRAISDLNYTKGQA